MIVPNWLTPFANPVHPAAKKPAVARMTMKQTQAWEQESLDANVSVDFSVHFGLDNPEYCSMTADRNCNKVNILPKIKFFFLTKILNQAKRLKRQKIKKIKTFVSFFLFFVF
jgi:hypothetical protein